MFLIGRETSAFGHTIGAHCAKKIVSEWEYFASADDKSVILEKTPKHVHSISKIRKVLPESKITLLVRNPLDNVASLYKRFGNLDACIRRWMADNRAILRHLGLEGVKLVYYEGLVSGPRSTLKEIVDFVGLEWEESIPAPGKTRYDAIKQEGNMAVRATQVNQSIQRNVGGWRKVLSEEQALHVLKRTKNVARKLGYSVRIDDFL
ncbi:MAG: sulfotransferase [Halothiobacillaceae bacterium]